MMMLRESGNGIFFEQKNLAERGEILGWVGSEGAVDTIVIN
jgi:hypothetical protein